MEEVFPPITLEAGRAGWTPRDKLARLVTLAREIGYCEDTFSMQAERAEERALFDELAGELDALDSLRWELSFPDGLL